MTDLDAILGDGRAATDDDVPVEVVAWMNAQAIAGADDVPLRDAPAASRSPSTSANPSLEEYDLEDLLAEEAP